MFAKRTLLFVSLGLTVWGFLASVTAGYYYYLYNDSLTKSQRPIVYVNIGINYGNDTSTKWFNRTTVVSGYTLLDTTMLVATVKYEVFPIGSIIDSINNVTNQGSSAWIWWMYTSYGWFQGQVASDRYIVGDNETYYWHYQNVYAWPPQPPPLP